MKPSIRQSFFASLCFAVVLTGTGCSGSGGSSSSGPTPPPVSTSSIVIDTAGQIPAPNGSNVATVVYVHNTSNKKVDNIKYVVKSSTGSDFIIDPRNTGVCKTISPNSSCALPFQTAHVGLGSRGSATITAIADGKNYDQVLNWYYYSPNSKAAPNFGNGSPNLATSNNNDRFITEYVVVDGKPGDILQDLQFGQLPGNVLHLTQGLSPTAQITTGQVVAVEFTSNIITPKTVSVRITPQAQLVQGPSLKNVHLRNLALSVNNVEGQAISLGIMPSNIANILVSNPVVLIPSANSQTLTVYNNGTVSGNVSDSVTSGNFAISSDSCNGQSLSAGSSCTFVYSNNGTADSYATGALSVSINGGNSVSLSLLFANPVNAPVPNISASTLYELLLPSQVAPITYTVTNSGGAPLSDVVYAPSTTGNSYFLESSSDTTCTGTLAAGDSCVVSGSLVASNTFEDNVYVSESLAGAFNSIFYTVSAATELDVESPTVLTFTQTTYTMPTIAGDGVASSTVTLTAVNTVGSSVAVLESPTLPSLPSSQTMLSNTCTSGVALAYGESCTVTYQSGPEALTEENGNESGVYTFTVNYHPASQPSDHLSSSANVQYLILAQDTYLVVTSVSPSGFSSGDGSADTPYSLNSYESDVSTVTPFVLITYKNASVNYSMTNFAIQTGTLPPFWSVDTGVGTTCGYANNTTTLAPGASCTLQLDLGRGYLYNGVDVTSNTSFNMMGASWQETGAHSSAGVVTQAAVAPSSGAGSDGSIHSSYVNTVITTTEASDDVHPTPMNGQINLTQTVTNAPAWNVPVSLSSLKGFAGGAPYTVTDTSSVCEQNGDGSVSCNYNSEFSSTNITYQFATPSLSNDTFTNLMFSSSITSPATVGFNPYYLAEGMSSGN